MNEVKERMMNINKFRNSFMSIFKDTNNEVKLNPSKVLLTERFPTVVKSSKDTWVDYSKYIVVYNKFDIDSIFAASIFKSKYPYIVICDNTKYIPSNGNDYIWIGITPCFNQNKKLYDSFINKNHVIINTVNNDNVNYLSRRPFTLYEQVSKLCNMVDNDTFKLGQLISVFNNKDNNIMDMVNLYVNYKKAICAIYTGKPFTPNIMTFNEEIKSNVDFFLKVKKNPKYENFKSIIESYLSFNSKIKSRINNNYSLSYTDTGKTVITNFSDEEYCWIKRILGFVYPNVLNIGLGSRGGVVDTNVSIKNLELKFEHNTSNAFC